MTKAENIRQYTDFCRRNNLAEDHSTASFFCEMFRRKPTLQNSRQIAQIYRYIEQQEDPPQ